MLMVGYAAVVLGTTDVQNSPVVHMFSVADVDVAAVLLGGRRTAPSGKRCDKISGNISQTAKEPHGSQKKECGKQPIHLSTSCSYERTLLSHMTRHSWIVGGAEVYS